MTSHRRPRLYPELAPTTIDQVTLIPAEPAEPEVPPRPQQVIKTLAHLSGMVDVWHAAGLIPALDRYLGVRPSSRNLRQFADFHHAVTTGAAILRYPVAS